MASLVVCLSWIKQSEFEPWAGTLCSILGQDTLLSQCLSPLGKPNKLCVRE